jgi:spermidine synthase
VNEVFFSYDLTNEKMYYLQERIQESPRMVNTDVRPVCYYFTTVLWGGVVTEPVRNFFVMLFKIHPLFFLLPLLVVFFFYRRRSIIYVSVFTVGASEIAAEIILIVLFQALYGYIYGWIGAIIACYMLGLACGTLYYLKSPAIRENAIRTLAWLEVLVAAYFGLIIILTFIMVPGTQIIIPVLIFGGGVFGGLHFPLSVKALTRQSAGYVYSTDLIGSSIGALLTAVILVPIVGIVYALVIFAILNLLVGIGLRTI